MSLLMTRQSYLMHALLQKASCSEDMDFNPEPTSNPHLPSADITEEIYIVEARPKSSVTGSD